jgi:hypothetical protein
VNSASADRRRAADEVNDGSADSLYWADDSELCAGFMENYAWAEGQGDG